MMLQAMDDAAAVGTSTSDPRRQLQRPDSLQLPSTSANTNEESPTRLRRRRHPLQRTNAPTAPSNRTRSTATCGRPPPVHIRLLVMVLAFSISTMGVGAAPERQQAQDPSILATFKENYEGKEVELEKMIMDRSTNRLYIGGVNHLFDVVADSLSVREHAVTGPRPDSILCADRDGEQLECYTLTSCKEPLVPTNSYTKALAIYPDSNKLIECTSLYQGRCRTRNLSNIRRETEVRSSRPGLVANDQHSSAVVFVGAGPAAALTSSPSSSSSSADQQPPRVLYVGSTYVPLSTGPRDALDVPAVSSVLLDNNRLFEFTSQSISSGTLMKLDYRRLPLFRIHYVGGFEANGFAYFATRQPKYTPSPEGQPTISKLVRVCTQDPNFYSYTEAPLECTRNGVEYNLLQDIHVGNPGYDLAAALKIKPTDLVLFGVFSKGEGADRNQTSRDSALCIYPLKQIEAKFFENIRICYRGHTRTNLPWFNSDKLCTATRYPDSEIMCGKDVNSYIGGEVPISSTALLVDKTSLFTSVVVSSVQTATVAFIGTSSGVLHKALVEPSIAGPSHIFNSIQLTPEGQPLLQSMELDDKNGLLYAMSKSTLYKVNARLCSQSTDCHSCLAASDPYCGWCMQTSGCTSQEVCDADALNVKTTWLNFKSGQCPHIRSVDPKEAQITSSKLLTIHIDNAPHAPTDQLYCSFHFPSGQKINSTAALAGADSTAITCPTPTRPSLKSLMATGGGDGQAPTSEDQQSVVASLAVVKQQDNAVIATTNFTFYDCSTLKSCGECANSRFPCDWCTMTARCVPNAEEVCQGEALVNAISRVGPASRRGPEHCPRFSAAEGDIYVASGRKRRISVQAHNLLDTMGNFRCLYTVEQEHKTHEKLASRRGDRIVCEDILFEYATPGLGNGTALASFEVVWSPVGVLASQLSHRLDNSQQMRIWIYKCPQLAPNCGLCLGLDTQRFECGWCDDDSRCAHKDSCPSGGWLTNKAEGATTPICPHPRIDDFEPKKGPINGGTKITITGTNLGLTYADVKDAVRVASAKCDVLEHDYVSSTRIVCHTRAPSTRQKQGQHVIFKLRDDKKYTAVSSSTFTYANPTITSFQPYRGPRSGGTDLTILGTDLDAGYNFNVSVGGVPCDLRQRSGSMVVCRTGASPAEKAEYLLLTADGTQVRVNNLQYQYSAIPEIEKVTRPVSTLSGGIALDVNGKGLDLLQRPRMVVTYEGSTYYGPKCEVVGQQLMVCRTPGLDDLPLHRRKAITSEHPLRVDYGFDLDGTLTGNLTTERMNFPKLAVYEDPIVHKYDEPQLIRGGGDLVIKGENLNLAATQRDVKVTIDQFPCSVTALSASTLTCLLPLNLQEDTYPVLLYIGDRVERVGDASTATSRYSNSSWLILAVAIAILGIFLALLLMVLYRRKNQSHTRQMRCLKNQMSSIESRVAQECKEAFHELQTNMNALAGPQGASFIPFLSCGEYTARLLFPNASPNDPILRDLEVTEDRATVVESGLRQLHNLLSNRNFLLSFVHTIDDNQYLLIKDRVYIGSLLMVILADKMEYCTDVLKQLLKDLIRRNLESKFQPKILFRRNENVAERMLSAWFGLTMYRFLRYGAGKQLYQLYWATKQQTEKGPQDALTLDARYSLSEEKLLRSSFEFRELTIFAITEPPCGQAMDTPVRVLDCDSIGQLKERCLDEMYKQTPFSERPSAGDVELELRTPTHRVILQDMDSTSKQESGGVWRYNTLAHYKVENGATIALLPRGNTTNSSYNLSMTGSGGGGDRYSDKSSMSPTLISHKQFGASGGYIPTNGNGNGNGSGSHQSNVHGAYGGGGSTLRAYHLVRLEAEQGAQDNQEKMVTEVYLTRLLLMKGTLQHFIEDLLEMIFSTTNGVCPMPPCIKYMFDFLDEQAEQHGIVDPDVVHAWKSNALPLRFWVNLIKNLWMLFDIQRPTKIEGSLNVVAQTIMDACSTQPHHLTKDSPSSKLLFANEIDKYKEWVRRFYAEIRMMPPIPEHEMAMLLKQESHDHSSAAATLKKFSALNELYVYVKQNRDTLMERLSQNEFALRDQLPEKLARLLETMEVPPGDATIHPVNNGSLDNYNSRSRLMNGSQTALHGSTNSRFY